MALEAGSVVVVSPAGVLVEQTEDAMRSIGLDVGKRFAEVAISEPGRGTRSGGRISASPDSLSALAATLGPDEPTLSPARLRGGVDPISALRHGVDRVLPEDTPTA
jgi:hypothetical protein